MLLFCFGLFMSCALPWLKKEAQAPRFAFRCCAMAMSHGSLGCWRFRCARSCSPSRSCSYFSFLLLHLLYSLVGCPFVCLFACAFVCWFGCLFASPLVSILCFCSSICLLVLLLVRVCSTSPPGGNQVDGLPPAPVIWERCWASCQSAGLSTNI